MTDTRATPPRSAPSVGYWVDFSRGWRTDRDGRSHKEQSAGVYHGSVTQEQAKELEHIVRDYLEIHDQQPSLTAYGMRDFVARAIAYWKSQPGEKAKEEVAELTAMVERPIAQSESAASEDERQAIEALRGLYGLIQLYASRMDMPADFRRWELNHRAVEARRVLACFEQNREAPHG